jgi:hypothetical protein
MVQDTQERLRALVAEESRTWVEIDDVVVCGRAYREVLGTAETNLRTSSSWAPRGEAA